jgi:predicted anti-sigma-YlaC factor YlaD
MTCIECDRLVANYLECVLAGPELAGFYRHLGACASCRSHLLAYRRVVILLGEEQHA